MNDGNLYLFSFKTSNHSIILHCPFYLAGARSHPIPVEWSTRCWLTSVYAVEGKGNKWISNVHNSSTTILFYKAESKRRFAK